MTLTKRSTFFSADREDDSPVERSFTRCGDWKVALESEF